MLLEILEQVAIKRYIEFKKDNVIQVSNIFMKALIREINSNIGYEMINYKPGFCEFEYNFGHRRPFLISSREFRDNTNDEDFENEIILKLNSIK